jgi:hypothetical protein
MANTPIATQVRIDLTSGEVTGALVGDTDRVGFNPQRQHPRTPFDYVMVGAALAVCLGLVVWAVVG